MLYVRFYMTEIIGYILTGLCLIGTFLNCKQIKYCFVIWFFANIGWLLYDFNTVQYYRCVLDIVQTITAVWGYKVWSKKK